MPEELRLIQLYSFLVIPLALLEGVLLACFSRGREKFTFFPASFLALCFHLLLLFLLAAVPGYIAAPCLSILPNESLLECLYFLLLLVFCTLVKLLLFRILAKFGGKVRTERIRIRFLLIPFLLLNIPVIALAGILGHRDSWQTTYDIRYTFPYGLDLLVCERNGVYADVSLRGSRGRRIPLDSVALPHPDTPGFLTVYRAGSAAGLAGSAGKSLIPFDSSMKTDRFRDLQVWQGSSGGLVVLKGKRVIVLNKQTLLYRWDTVSFAILPDTDVILLSAGTGTYLFDCYREILYPLPFVRGRIAAMGIREIPEAAASGDPVSDEIPLEENP